MKNAEVRTFAKWVEGRLGNGCALRDAKSNARDDASGSEHRGTILRVTIKRLQSSCLSC